MPATEPGARPYNRRMSTPRLPLRLILLAVLALGTVLALGFVAATLNHLLELYERISALPLWLRGPLIGLGGLLLAVLTWLLWRLARPARRPTSPSTAVPVSRIDVDARLQALRDRHADTTQLDRELAELDRRRDSGELYVALFGAISTGKSSLIRALAPQATPAINVRGGTTRQVAHHRGTLADGRTLILADVPGSGEIDGTQRAELARDEVLRAHAVIYLTDADLTRTQHAELRWLAAFRKPLLLALNKTDWYDAAERTALLQRFRQRLADQAQAIVAISAGGSEHFERVLADGRRERVERERHPDLTELLAALSALTRGGAGALEPAREAAVLAEVGRRGDELMRTTAAREAAESIGKYTRRAVVGALAAVAPGSDLLIQGALATGLVRELARIHGVAVRDIDIEALLTRIAPTVRNTSALLLAIVGNALKAFPGLGTLGGGALHAIAYGLVFDSLGHALSATLATHTALDAVDIETRLQALLAQPQRERIERIARAALGAMRDAPAEDAHDHEA